MTGDVVGLGYMYNPTTVDVGNCWIPYPYPVQPWPQINVAPLTFTTTIEPYATVGQVRRLEERLDRLERENRMLKSRLRRRGRAAARRQG